MSRYDRNETIAALATAPGGALSIIRVSGPKTFEIADRIFHPKSGSPLSGAQGFSIHYGEISDSERIIDDVLVSVFRAPRSYTGDDMLEISCHGSVYIVKEILQLLSACGARPAEPGEFTVRAFLAGKLDLSQAEAVADLIASTEKASHSLASNQMRGGYSDEFASMRQQLVDLTSLLELELDFSEEDVEFADRKQLSTLLHSIKEHCAAMLSTFEAGNAIKEGVAVAIAGPPNAGKSTLLNTLLNDDRAMVSDIAGTTRDSIEESMVIDGIKFRFIDTAGIRSTKDTLERMGIERTFDSISKADLVLYVTEIPEETENISGIVSTAAVGLRKVSTHPGQKAFIILNKADKQNGSLITNSHIYKDVEFPVIAISAKHKYNIEELRSQISSAIDPGVYTSRTILTNSRHYESLLHTSEALARAISALEDNLPADLLSQDIREGIYHLGTITGEITTDEILGNIFSKFCIGK